MSFEKIFNPEIIDYQTEHDGAPFVVPYTRVSSSFVVAFVFEACAELVIGKAYRLRESINYLADIEVYPNIGGKVGGIVFIDKLLGDVGEFDINIFRLVKRDT